MTPPLPGVRTVRAAQRGDERALADLASGCLPLLYNIVGRALNGHADVDDVVQETLLRALRGVSGLRQPDSFRSWLVAVAIRQIRDHHRSRPPVTPLDDVPEVADPGADFAEATILRLSLSGQRREIAEATRWLDADDRELLSLWWLEEGGLLERADLVAALDLPGPHVAVRVRRMKERLDLGRAVVRALGDPDAFTATDLGVRVAARHLGLPGTPAALIRHSAAWRPWRAYAVQHLWATGDHAINRIPA
ncbi:sigma-70 family RNA polymerase sigma factor [Actinoallomurus acaciae]|uniref:RNA polymerase sigma factor n=1 Tax=Actinoallomurus acaciae TaxID=502577 RepID=A0ABV5YIG3_9ACTN